MIEITISRKSKIPTEQYGNKEIMASVKAQVLDGTDISEKMESLNKDIELLLDREEKKVRAAMKVKSDKGQ